MRTVALCVVGEWRTFGMSALHAGVRQVADVWDADLFLFYHTRYNASEMTHPHRENAQACAFSDKVVQSLNSTLVQLLPPLPCSFKAVIQFQQISACFRAAQSYEMEHGLRYHTYVRTRPDYLLVNPRPLPRTAHVYAVRPKPDMAFVVPRALLHTWYEGMDTACVPYGGNECCIEYVHRMFASTKVWTQEGGIVRNRNSITYSTIRERPLNSRLRCNITGVPHTWP